MSFDPILVAVVGMIAISVFLFEWSMLRSRYSTDVQREKQLKQRLEKIKEETRESGELLLRENDAKNGIFNIFPGADFIKQIIMQSGSHTTLFKFYLQTAALSSIAGFLVWYYFHNALFAAATATFGGIIPFLILRHLRSSRIKSFDDLLSEGIDIIIRALRAGHPFDVAIKMISEELRDPIAEEFSLTHAEISYGVPIKIALENLLERVPSKPLKAFVTAVIVQRETGGNLAEILENISSVIRGGYRFQRKVRTLSAEGKMSANVLAAVPLVLGAVMLVIAPDLIAILFTTETGEMLLQIGIVLLLVGYMWIRWMVKIEV